MKIIPKTLVFLLSGLLAQLFIYDCQLVAHGKDTEYFDFKGNVLYVKDGDSLVVESGTNRLQIRLWGIDAPEYDQPHSTASKKILEKLVTNQIIKFSVKDRDKYGRLVCVASTRSYTINKQMIERGAAWVYRYYCVEPVCSKWLALEKRAFRNRIGLWQDENPIEPWVWKKR